MTNLLRLCVAWRHISALRLLLPIDADIAFLSAHLGKETVEVWAPPRRGQTQCLAPTLQCVQQRRDTVQNVSLVLHQNVNTQWQQVASDDQWC